MHKFKLNSFFIVFTFSSKKKKNFSSFSKKKRNFFSPEKERFHKMGSSQTTTDGYAAIFNEKEREEKLLSLKKFKITDCSSLKKYCKKVEKYKGYFTAQDLNFLSLKVFKVKREEYCSDDEVFTSITRNYPSRDDIETLLHNQEELSRLLEKINEGDLYSRSFPTTLTDFSTQGGSSLSSRGVHSSRSGISSRSEITSLTSRSERSSLLSERVEEYLSHTDLELFRKNTLNSILVWFFSSKLMKRGLLEECARGLYYINSAAEMCTPSKRISLLLKELFEGAIISNKNTMVVTPELRKREEEISLKTKRYTALLAMVRV